MTEATTLYTQITIEISNFNVDFDGKWSKVKELVEAKATRQGEEMETQVHLIISDRGAVDIGEGAFKWCRNLWKGELKQMAMLSSLSLSSPLLASSFSARSHPLK